MIQKLKLCKCKKKNSSYYNTLYAVFDGKGYFLYYMIDKEISLFLEDFVDIGYSFIDVSSIYDIPCFCCKVDV